MERALLKEKEAFKRRALATPAVENKLRKVESHSNKSSGSGTSSSKAKPPELNYKTASGGSSQLRFGVLARIVRHMKQRHQEGETHALTLEEILDETNQLNVGHSIKNWLQSDALPNNPKLAEGEGGHGYVFNPPLQVRDKKSLLKLLRMNDLRGTGGILLEHIQESVPQYAKVMKALTKDIIIINRQVDKKHIVFYHDSAFKYSVSEEFVQLWRNATVDSMHDDNIDEYLNKQGIKSMQEVTKVFRPARRKAKARRTQKTRLNDNEHLAEILKDYEAEQQ